jgi:O-succinylbenzoic acid--CoA ligase
VKIEPWPTPWIARRAAATPGAEAIVWEEGRLRYDELGERADGAARALRALGVREGDVVGVLAGNTPAAFVAIHAIQLAGAVLLPLNLRLAEAELVPQLRRAGARFLLFAEGEVARGTRLLTALPETHGIVLGEAEGAWVRLSPPPEATRAPPCDESLCESTAPDRPLALLYTSGTTGRPRAATLTGANFWHAAAASAERLGGEAGDRWLACLPLFHVGGLSIVFRSVLAGTSVLLHERFEPRAVARALDADRVQLASFVATMLQRVLEVRAERASPSSLRVVLLGGGPAPRALLERARALGYPIAPTYGLTEACSQVATRHPADRREPLDGHLQPLAGVQVRIVDEGGAALPPGAEGEIQVRGPSVMAGYWREPEAGARVFAGGWLVTGDVGVLDANGELRVLDRRSDLIVSGGENVYPAEVESVLLEHADVREAGVVGVADGEFGARPVACVVAEPGATRDAAALRVHCRERLAAYKVPARIEWRESLPRTVAGKLRRAVLQNSL